MKYFVIFLAGLSMIMPLNVMGEPVFPANPDYRTFTITKDIYQYMVPYRLDHGIINSMTLDCSSSALMLSLENTKDEMLVISIPRVLLDAKRVDGSDDEFMVLVDGMEPDYRENSSLLLRALIIPVSKNSVVEIVFPTLISQFGEGKVFCAEQSETPPYSFVLAPLQQIKKGITATEIRCSNELVLLQKYDGSPVCVKSETVLKLVERGWTKNDLQKPGDSSDTTARCQGSKLCLTEEVTRIIDGDTIYLTGGYKVRLSLTNTPEINESGFYEASQFTANMCPVGSTVMVDQDDLQPYDVYNRLLGKVICDNKVLNAELLYNDHANILTRYCSTSEFSNESWAQEFGC